MSAADRPALELVAPAVELPDAAPVPPVVDLLAAVHELTTATRTLSAAMFAVDGRLERLEQLAAKRLPLFGFGRS